MEQLLYIAERQKNSDFHEGWLFLPLYPGPDWDNKSGQESNPASHPAHKDH